MSRIQLTKHRDKAKKLIADALIILDAIGVPVDNKTERANERVALTLAALADLKPTGKWKDAVVWDDEDPRALTTREIIAFRQEHFEEEISSGSYDDVRRKDLQELTLSGLVVKSAKNPTAATNNPNRGYAIATECQTVFQSFGTKAFTVAVKEFKNTHGDLARKLKRARDQSKIPVTLPDGTPLNFEPGHHNNLQVAVINELIPRFLPGSEILYIADANNKSLHLEQDRLKELGFFELSHDLLPDIVAYYPKRGWIALIEAVHSSNPLSPHRHLMLEELVKTCTAPAVYLSVFATRKSFRSWVEKISWETEVWIANEPDHMIHFNGDRFLGPH